MKTLTMAAFGVLIAAAGAEAQTAPQKRTVPIPAQRIAPDAPQTVRAKRAGEVIRLRLRAPAAPRAKPMAKRPALRMAPALAPTPAPIQFERQQQTRRTKKQ